MVEQLIRDIRLALQEELYAVALVGALTLPDICASMEAPDGRASKENYIAWLKAQIYQITKDFKFEDLYHARCQVLHQGETKHQTQIRPIRWLVRDAEGHESFFPNEPVDWNGNTHGLYLPGICEMLCLAAERWLEGRGKH